MDKTDKTIILDNILTRTSDRSFIPDKEIDNDYIQEILHAAMAAPSGVNRQPWHFFVVTDRQKLESLAASLPYCHMAASASMAIVVCGDSDRFLSGTDSTLWVQDVSASSENILLASHALGLGAVWTALYPHPDRMEIVGKILSIPARYVPFNVIPVGYIARSHSPIDKWNPENVTFVE